MDDQQIDALLAVFIGLLMMGAVLFYLRLSLLRSPNEKLWGWLAIALVAGLGVAIWKGRHGGDVLEILVFGGLGVAAAYVILAGAAARARTSGAMLNPGQRANSHRSRVAPKDFSDQ